MLDENLLLADPACGGGYLGLGVREVSPDGRLLAYSVDFDGDELYQLRIRDLARGSDLPEQIEGTYYGLAWSADSRSLLYVVSDAWYRPHEVWRHVLGTDPGQDTLVFREEDQRFELTVRTTRSGAYLLIETASRDSTETLVLPAAVDRPEPAVMEKKKPGCRIPRRARRGPGQGEFFLVTNADAEEFRLVAASADAPGRARWRQVIAGSPHTRLVSCDVFGRYLVVEQRHAGRHPAADRGPPVGGGAADQGRRPGGLARPGGQRGLQTPRR